MVSTSLGMSKKEKNSSITMIGPTNSLQLTLFEARKDCASVRACVFASDNQILLLALTKSKAAGTIRIRNTVI